MSAIELLQEWVDIHGETCRYDHHGYCQEHFLEEDCIVKRSRILIEKHRANQNWEGPNNR